jgi:uncharacterized protein (TIGR02246 family)
MRSVAFVAVAFAIVSAAAQAQQPAPSGQAAAKGSGSAAIVAVADTYVKATLAGDAKAVAALYTDNAIEMPPHVPSVKGRTAIEQFYQKSFAGAKINSLTLTHLETQAMGDNGYDVGTYEQTVTPQGAKAPIKDTGKYTVVLKRAGGAWKVAYAIYNSDMPPPAPQR